MPDQLSDPGSSALEASTPPRRSSSDRGASEASGEAATPGRRRRKRTDWRLGGTAVRRWDLSVLSAALIGVGLGVVGGGAVSRIAAPWAATASTVVLWLGLGAAVAFAFARSRPAGLLRFRPIDVLWGVGLGLGLRLLQGWVSGVDAAAFPSAMALDGGLPSGWWLTEAIPAGLVAPLVEEFFFRTVVLVAVYQLLRRSVGGVAAGVTAALVSAGGFVLLHATAGALTLVDGIQLFAVGGTCALVVLLTGRIWGAVLTHVVYNVSYLVLVVVGTWGAVAPAAPSLG
ncbi:CPBP family intramembrane glutamic endopeptidase [Microbacterium sp. 69-7]|mgnify:CR=1 FL=1|uniref:CPBP family intramembrane glutamic endopeptidase n=1 Tax=Microbacterium sp. 69-7 TaxID=1895784 RepID=UPI000A67E173|nr:CPBP family intramembrane glutamic endopeptidase [Microbacterium sp. 69-7]